MAGILPAVLWGDFMKAILLANVLHNGRRYSAGEELNLDVVTAGKFERAGLVRVEAAPKQPAGAPDLPSAERKAKSVGKNASAPKKAGKGQK